MTDYGTNTVEVEKFMGWFKTLTTDEVGKVEESRTPLTHPFTDCITALIIKHLITKADFATLTAPFADILTELGITYESRGTK